MHPPALANNRQNVQEPVACFARWQERLIAAEQSDGWLVDCDDAGRFLAVSRELVDALSAALRQLAGDGSVLEVCAGSGELASQLASSGVRLQATDAEPPEGSEVLRVSAQAALLRFQPTVVLGIFVPFDAGVDEVVLACPSVRHYVILNARIGGSLGSSALWRTPGWEAKSLDDIGCWMITRHDVCLAVGEEQPQQTGDVLQRGEAWHFTRTSTTPSVSEGERR